MLNIHRIEELVGIDGREAKRCHSLIATIPKINRDEEMSRPRTPNWIIEEKGDEVEADEDENESIQGALYDELF